MKVKSESEVIQSCLTLRDLMDCGPPGSFVHGIFQARVLEWGAIASPLGDGSIIHSSYSSLNAPNNNNVNTQLDKYFQSL